MNSGFKIEITCDNDAYSDGWEIEVARQLREIANKVENHCQEYGIIQDYNGNTVGEFSYHVGE